MLLLALALQIVSSPFTDDRVQWVDHDADGLEDAYLLDPRGAHRLLRNQGDGTFADVTHSVGLNDAWGSTKVGWDDYDGDGFPDVAALGADGVPRLWKNAGGTFVVTAALDELADGTVATDLAWHDVDRDEAPDLVLVLDSRLHVLRNVGGGVLESSRPGAFALLGDFDEGDPSRTALPASRTRANPEPTIDVAGPGGSVLSPDASLLGAAMCLPNVADQATGSCLQASSVPTLGMLHPLGEIPILDLGNGTPAGSLSAPDPNTVALEVLSGRDLEIRFPEEGGDGALSVVGPVITPQLQLFDVQGTVVMEPVEDPVTSNFGVGIQADCITIKNGAGDTVCIEPRETFDPGDVGETNPIVMPYVNDIAVFGEGSVLSGLRSTVAGGYGNQAIGKHDSVGGGLGNVCESTGDGYATIGGGHNNQAKELGATVAGGRANKSIGQDSFVGGGTENEILAGSSSSAIAGGQNNDIKAGVSFIGGGNGNIIEVAGSVIAGGTLNKVDVGSFESFIGGGNLNDTNGDYTVVAGGQNNTTIATGGGNNSNYAVVGGGQDNSSLSLHTTVAGGKGNTAEANGATVPGGTDNTASGFDSFAAGSNATAAYDNSFVWSDGSSAPFASTGVDQFLIEASGGVGINTASPGANMSLKVAGNACVDGGDLTVSGEVCASNVSCTSDARLKKDVIDLEDALETVLALRGVTFEWAPDTMPGQEGRRLGFLAQEVRDVVPEVVSENAEGMLSVAYSSLVPLLVEALREQRRTTDERLSDIEAQLKLLRESAGPTGSDTLR